MAQTATERLRHVTLKLKRAKEHTAALEKELRAFLDSEPYKVGAKHHPQSGKLVYYVTSVDPTPECLPLLTGDAIQNLMGALDHLAYQLVCIDTADAPPRPNRIYFPVADDVNQYNSNKENKLAGARQETINAIDLLAPYKGGNDPLWSLHKLNNIEKHRLLFTVGSQAAGIHLGQLIAKNLSGQWPDAAVEQIASMNAFLNSADKGFPLEPGFELYIGGVNEQPNPRQTFRFTVALNEPGIVDGKPLLETVQQLTGAVEGVLATLAPRIQ